MLQKKLWQKKIKPRFCFCFIQKLNARADYLSYIIFIFCHSMNSQPLNCCVCIDITAYAQKYWDI